MTTYRLNDFDQVTLDASGNGTAQLQPSGTEKWHVTRITVVTNQAPSTTPIPVCAVYTDSVDPGNVYDITYTGSQDATDADLWLEKGQLLLARWTGGIAATVGTVSVFGERVVY